MKKIFKIVLIAVLLSGGIITDNQVKAQSVSVSLSVFQRSLSPYGRWVNNNRYGQVWIANERNFTPYETGGHWAYTDYGWTWVSDYEWGWAPFHYGRWDWEPSLGWYWVPGYDWGPAWVAWRDGGDYYGWAPLAPGLNVSVGVSFGSRIPSGRWVFAPHRYITSRDINRYYAPRTRNVTIIKNTRIVNNVTVRNNVHIDAGPRRDEVERINHTKIKTYTVANSSRPGKTVVNKNTVNVYRPVVNKTTVNNHNKTVVNKNSNNKTVNKNSNNTSVNKSKTTVKNNSNKTIKKDNTTINKNEKNVQQNKSTTVNKKQAAPNKSVTKTQAKKPAVNKKTNNDQKKIITNKKQPDKNKTTAKPKQQVHKQPHQAKPNARDTNNNKPRAKKK